MSKWAKESEAVMSPEKLLNDPSFTPLLMGMVIKIKNWTELKGIAVAVTFIITTSFAVGVFYTQTNAMINEGRAFREDFTFELNNIKKEIALIQKEMAITNNNVSYIRKDIDRLTAQVGEIISNGAKIRR